MRARSKPQQTEGANHSKPSEQTHHHCGEPALTTVSDPESRGSNKREHKTLDQTAFSCARTRSSFGSLEERKMPITSGPDTSLQQTRRDIS
jgi:hypothetical protein